jgi:hypothetical protein
MIKKPGHTRDRRPLHVIVPISNPVRYHSRYRLFHQFKERMEANPWVRLHVVECAFGDRKPECADKRNRDHHVVRSLDELWHKENLINIGISRLPEDWEYVAWIDADVEFTHPHWARETVHQLQHHHLVQLFQNALDLGPTGAVVHTHTGFGYLYATGAPRALHSYYNDRPFWHPGFAWAATREAINGMGGLIDWAILGSADHHMALAWIGEAAKSLPKGVHPNFRSNLLNYQARCEKHIKRDLGYIDGTILHHWHGRKKDRKYVERWDVLLKNKFDPHTHIYRDSQGLWQLDPDHIKLRDGIRTYMRQRNEDSIDEVG